MGLDFKDIDTQVFNICRAFRCVSVTYDVWNSVHSVEFLRKKGLYATNFGGGQVDITSGKFVFSASEAYWVENGKILYPVKGATLIGSGPESLKKISMIGNDMRLDSGVGTCGKEGQSVPVGVGQPTLRIDGLTVGGTVKPRWGEPLGGRGAAPSR